MILQLVFSAYVILHLKLRGVVRVRLGHLRRSIYISQVRRLIHHGVNQRTLTVVGRITVGTAVANLIKPLQS